MIRYQYKKHFYTDVKYLFYSDNVFFLFSFY